MTTQWTSYSDTETTAWGCHFGNRLNVNSIVCLFGELGAGKTTFIKGIAQAFSNGSSAHVTSPTFSYLNIYQGCPTLYHFDLYRLRNSDEFLSMGFDDFFFAGGVCCIEWSERIASLLPHDSIQITLIHVGEGIRQIMINK